MMRGGLFPPNFIYFSRFAPFLLVRGEEKHKQDFLRRHPKLSFMLAITSVYFVSNYQAVKAALLTPPIGPNDDITHGSAYGCV